MKIEVISGSAAKTREIGARLGKEILKKKETVFISLKGDLGSGKTTFIKGLARQIGVKEDVTSPTFLIYKKYEGLKEFYHFDAYRIREEDLSLLRFSEILEKSNIIIAVEWSENIKKSLPQKRIKISFSFISPKERRLMMRDNSGIIKDSFLL